MDMQFSDADLAFRDEVREFLATELPDDIRERWVNGSLIFPDRDDAVRWQKILHKKGWIAPNWPEEHGGPGWTVSQKFIFETETAEAGAPPVIPLGLRMVGPVIMRYGTDEQKTHFLPRILSTDDYWCQGYSEPGSGSDLASLKTRAVKDGDDYVINGSKIWTTHAHFADWMFALVRTSTEGKPQQGISFVLIPMDTPGIEIRPLITLGGHHEVNQVFLTDVRVPQANRVGEENDGWTVAKYLLEFERGGNFYTGRINVNLARLRKLARENGCDQDPAFKKHLAELEVEFERGQRLRTAHAVVADHRPESRRIGLHHQAARQRGLAEGDGDDHGCGGHVCPAVRAVGAGGRWRKPAAGRDTGRDECVRPVLRLPRGDDLRRLQRGAAQYPGQGESGAMRGLLDKAAAEAFVRAAAPAAGLDLDEAEVKAVIGQVQIMAGLAALLPADLADDLEPAPRFEP